MTWCSPLRHALCRAIADECGYDIVGVDLSRREVNDHELTLILLGSTELEFLYLHHARNVTDAGLAQLNNMRALKVLRLDDTSVSGSGLTCLRGHSRLEYLTAAELRLAVRVQEFGDLPSLRFLSVRAQSGVNPSFASLGRLNNLEYLDVSNTRFYDDDLDSIKGLQKLQWLDLRCTAVTDEGLKALAGLKSLRHCSLGGMWGITDKGLRHLNSLDQLVYLNLSATGITARGLANIESLANLEHLILSYTGVDDDAVPHLRRLARLKNLWVESAELTRAGIKALRKALPNTTIHERRTPYQLDPIWDRGLREY